MVKVRDARPADADGIRAVHASAFPTPSEAELVEKLTQSGDAVISLVAADDDGTIIGHILFSRMEAEGDGKVLAAMGLAPVAVVRDWRNQGIGTALIHSGLRVAESRGADIVFVLGELGYYRRFGFDTKAAAPFQSPYAGPNFQALVLEPRFKAPAQGRAAYAPAFADLG